ncbi:MAG TPA: hypothetical protein VFN71_14745 [Methylomirabilota bacterium]|nr:hypothetical protein [Methylomirabilota bacterium]
MRLLATLLVGCWLAGTAPAWAQSAPVVPRAAASVDLSGRPAGAVELGKPYQPRPGAPLSPAPVPEGRWVPERRVFVPELGRQVVVPSHFERRISDQTYQVPTLPVAGPRGEQPAHLLGGERLAPTLRNAP